MNWFSIGGKVIFERLLTAWASAGKSLLVNRNMGNDRIWPHWNWLLYFVVSVSYVKMWLCCRQHDSSFVADLCVWSTFSLQTQVSVKLDPPEEARTALASAPCPTWPELTTDHARVFWRFSRTAGHSLGTHGLSACPPDLWTCYKDTTPETSR